jgi:putative ABC transport system permease protein
MYHIIALRNVKVHWKQSLAAFLSIAAAFVCLVLFQGYMNDVEDQYFDSYRNRSMLGDLLIQNKIAQTPEGQKNYWKYTLTHEDQNKINQVLARHSNEIETSVHYLTFQGMISSGISSKIFIASATDIVEGAKARGHWKYNVLYGKPLFETLGQNAMLLGQTLGEQLGCVPEKIIYAMLPEGGYTPDERPFKCRRSDFQLSVTTKDGNLNAMDFDVVGLIDAGYRDTDSRFISMGLEQAQTLMGTDQISYQSVKFKKGLDAVALTQKLDAELKELNPELMAIDWKDHIIGDLYVRTMSLLNIFRNFVTVIVSFISVLSVMNTMVKIVKERTREIGTLRSLGFQRIHILKIFIYEAFFLGMFGVLAGVVSAGILTILINAVGITYKAGMLSEAVPFQIMFSFKLYASSLLLLMAVTLVTSFVSIWSTINQKIVDCLGHV